MYGQVAELPYLNGNSDDEASYYKIPAYAQNVTLNASSWDEFNLEDFTFPTSTDSIMQPMVSLCGASDTLPNGTTCGSTPTLAAGTYHGSDFKMVLGVSRDIGGLPGLDPRMQLQACMMQAWAAFANDEEIGWRAYNSAEATLVA
jgi:hypothetical protein